ncbi:hypothetical protein SLS62_002107 [Diatrype stigma]|uniref:Gag1-like clamp domain-containing protein n=1 Tax=Diatrype stigma TaxID=117547 RepID=A0AAN9YV69_9PEZI
MFDEETSVMMQEANLELSDRLSSGSHGSHHRRERDAAIQSTKTKSDSSLSAISSKSIRRFSGVDPDYDADLTSRDKAKQKEAIKRYLAERIRNDWVFKWPPSTAIPSPGKEHVTEEHVVGNVGDGAGLGRQPMGDCAVVDTSSEEDSEDGDDDDTISTYSSVSEDLDHFRPRAEWLSDLSDEDAPTTKTSSSAYRFNNPEAVATSAEASELARSAKRRKAVRDESQWNDGLACFTARRDAWTGAKTLRVRMKSESPAPPATVSAPPPPTPPPVPAPSSKRHSWFRLSISAPPHPDLSGMTIPPASPTGTQVSGDTMVAAVSASPPSSSSSCGGNGESAARKQEEMNGETGAVCRHRRHKIETLLPIPAPLLPPANPMRASITPVTYPGIYDKIVTHSMTPSCPVNLRDVIRACVSGWKRDGEWPVRPAEIVPVVAVRQKKKTSATATTRARDGGGRASNNTASTNNSNNNSNKSARSKSSTNKPNATRRLSLGFLGRKDTHVGAAAAAAGGPQLTQTQTHTGSSSSGRGLRKSFQRVLGLGHDRIASNAAALG